MNRLLLALACSLPFGIAHANQTDTQAMKKCNDEATAQGLVDQNERKTFITQCLMRETRNDGAGQARQKANGTGSR